MASTTETDMTTRMAKPGAQGSEQSAAQVEKTLRGRDEFYKETYRFFDVLAHHRKAVIAVAVMMIGVCVAGGIMANRHEAKSEAGRDALFLAVKAYDTELKGLAGVKTPAPAEAKEQTPEEIAAADKADPKAKTAREALAKAKRAEEEASNKRAEELSFSRFDVDAKFPESVKKYNEVIAKFDGTRAAHEARMALGTLYYNHGDGAKAAPIFQAASNSAPGNYEKAIALQSWGYALENDGKFADAVTAYEKALKYGEGSIKGDVLLAIARSHEAMHDAAKARSTYDQIISQLPNTDAAKSAEGLKAKL